MAFCKIPKAHSLQYKHKKGELLLWWLIRAESPCPAVRKSEIWHLSRPDQVSSAENSPWLCRNSPSRPSLSKHLEIQGSVCHRKPLETMEYIYKPSFKAGRPICNKTRIGNSPWLSLKHQRPPPAAARDSLASRASLRGRPHRPSWLREPFSTVNRKTQTSATDLPVTTGMTKRASNSVCWRQIRGKPCSSWTSSSVSSPTEMASLALVTTCNASRPRRLI